ncbi:MAG: hypothetical protein WDA27_00025 [Actinomycetota bacterium]
MSGVLDPEYVAARRVLLDALEALREQLDAIVLVGAQAIYVHTGAAEFAIAEYTTDADLVLDPAELHDQPRIEQAMTDAGFVRDLRQPGIWRGRGDVQVDLLVPEAVGGAGRRGARLGVHGDQVARKAKGLEAVLVERAPVSVASLDHADSRSLVIMVAGPAALLVSKLHKIYERRDSPDRLADKDALDTFRILRAIPTETLAAGVNHLLVDDRSRDVARAAIDYLRELFGTPEAQGCQMAGRALVPLEDPVEIAAACSALALDLLHPRGES